MPTQSGLVRNSQLQWIASRFEVIAEGEVAEHLEEGAVARVLPTFSMSPVADALLARW